MSMKVLVLLLITACSALIKLGCFAFSLRPIPVSIPSSKGSIKKGVKYCIGQENALAAKLGAKVNSEDGYFGGHQCASSEIPIDRLTQSHGKIWPCGDELDRDIMKLFVPAILNFAIFPLVGAADTFWVGRMKNALALAGQGAANQVFNSVSWVISFLPSVMTPLVAKAHGAGDSEGIRQRIGESYLLCVIIGKS